jgi:hypothetical protein
MGKRVLESIGFHRPSTPAGPLTIRTVGLVSMASTLHAGQALYWRSDCVEIYGDGHPHFAAGCCLLDFDLNLVAIRSLMQSL